MPSDCSANSEPRPYNLSGNREMRNSMAMSLLILWIGALINNCDLSFASICADSLICSEPSVTCQTGQYADSVCWCTLCPSKPSTPVEKWKFQCLTEELKVCPGGISHPPIIGSCDDTICSARTTTCAAGHYPDSACTCSAACPSPESGNLHQIECVRRFCDNCTEEQLHQCRSCDSGLHNSKGECRLCPNTRRADRPAGCDHEWRIPISIAIVVFCILAAVATVLAALFIKRGCNRQNTKLAGESTGKCLICGKFFIGYSYLSDANFCKCNEQRHVANNQPAPQALPLPVVRADNEDSGAEEADHLVETV